MAIEIKGISGIIRDLKVKVDLWRNQKVVFV